MGDTSKGEPVNLNANGKITQNKNSFMERPLLLFKNSDNVKSISGECFIQFLSFLLRAAVKYNPSSSSSSISKVISKEKLGPIWQQLHCFFSQEAKAIMCEAHHQIETAKKKGSRWVVVYIIFFFFCLYYYYY